MVIQYLISLVISTFVALFAKSLIEKKMADLENMSMDRR